MAKNEAMRMRRLIELEQPDIAYTAATQEFFAVIFRLAQLGKTDRNGMPNLALFVGQAFGLQEVYPVTTQNSTHS